VNLDLTIEELAARQLRDYQNLVPGTYFGEHHDLLSIDEAYQVQMAVSHLRVRNGDAVVGYKVGCTSVEILAQLGIQGPIYGVLFESELRRSGVTLDHSAFANLAIEGEMAVRIGADGEIAAAFPVIELHNFVFRSERKTLSELVANNGLNAGVVLPGDDGAATSALVRQDGSLKVVINGECVDEGNLWSLPGGAAGSIRWLNGKLKRHGLNELRPGALVLTSTPLGLHPVKPGDCVSVIVDGREYVRCRVC
jgi:2-keto-4-pentenoate hydratase